MVTIFSYLNPQELCQCSQVSTEWSQLAKTGSLWKHLYPVRWARGKLNLIISLKACQLQFESVANNVLSAVMSYNDPES